MFGAHYPQLLQHIARAQPFLAQQVAGNVRRNFQHASTIRIFLDRDPETVMGTRGVLLKLVRAEMKRSKKFERLCFFLKGGEGTSAAQPIDEPPLKVRNEPQISVQSMNFDDLDEEDWPSRDSFRVDTDFSNVTIESSCATESERETIVSTSSSTSSRRSSILREPLEKTEKAEKAGEKVRELTQQIAEMNKALTKIQAMCAANPTQQQEPVVRESATTKLPNDSKIELMTAPTKDLVVDTIQSWA